MQERFVVRYVIDWGDAPCERVYPSLAVAEEFAKGVTTDGTTAFPHLAGISRQTTEGEYGTWRDDPAFRPVEISRGTRTDGPETPV